MDIWYGVIVGFFAGCVISMLVFIFIIGKWYIGILREDNSSEEENPLYFMEVVAGASPQLKKNRYALFKIVRKNYVSKSNK